MTIFTTYHGDIADPSSPLNCTRKSAVLASPTSSVVHENKAATANVDLFSYRPPKNVLGAPLLGMTEKADTLLNAAKVNTAAD